ncbi:MAG: C1 family peptidase, partial [Candidatus Pacearchaeota archaeon]
MLIFLTSYVYALPNPAAVYCSEMGYEYKIVETALGQKGICVMPNKERCEEWSFLRGECGKEFSYCSKHGYELKSKNGMAFCIVPENDETGKKIMKEVPVNELLDLTKSSKCLYAENRARESFKEKFFEESKEDTRLLTNKEIPIKTYNASDFPYWDWRNPPNGTRYSKYNFTFFDEIHGWLTSVKDQEACGSCWAFSTIASLEAKHEINQNNSRLNPDLSEQHEVSCDRTFYPPPDNDTCNIGCSGGFMDLALYYIKNYGNVDENCFPYTANNSSCSNRCPDYESRRWNITNYSVLWPSNLTNDQVKQLLIDNGPLIVAIGFGNSERCNAGFY